jgi:H+/Cl- antiporter ClcA
MTISTVAAVVLLAFYAPIIAILVVVFGGTYLWATIKAWNLRRQGYGYLLTPLPKKQSGLQIMYTVVTYLVTAAGLIWLYFTLKYNAHVSMYDLLK